MWETQNGFSQLRTLFGSSSTTSSPCFAMRALFLQVAASEYLFLAPGPGLQAQPHLQRGLELPGAWQARRSVARLAVSAPEAAGAAGSRHSVFAALSGFAVAALAVGGYASSSTVLADARDSAIADLDAEIANTEAKLYTLKQEKLAAEAGVSVRSG